MQLGLVIYMCEEVTAVKGSLEETVINKRMYTHAGGNVWAIRLLKTS